MKVLEGELKKLQSSIEQSMQNFDDRLAKLFRLKLKTELAINQVCFVAKVNAYILFIGLGRAKDFTSCSLTINRRRNKSKRRVAQSKSSRVQKSEGQIKLCGPNKECC